MTLAFELVENGCEDVGRHLSAGHTFDQFPAAVGTTGKQSQNIGVGPGWVIERSGNATGGQGAGGAGAVSGEAAVTEPVAGS